MSIRARSHRLKETAPHWLVRSMRALMSGWGLATARWRMEPSFIIVGAQRSGTTTLFRLLSEHPEVMRPTQAKGIGFFDVNYERGFRWYMSHFPLAFLARLRAGRRAVTFESSGYYLFHPLAPGRLSAAFPGIKIVVVVREPVERAYSAHRHEAARGFESLSFEDAIAAEVGRLAGEEERLRTDPTYQSFEHRHHAYLGRSRYSNQIRRYIDEFGADQVHVVDADRFFEDPTSEFQLLCDRLGLSTWSPREVAQWNAQKRDPLSASLRAELDAHFVPFDKELELIMKRVPHWRRETSR